MLLQWMLGYMCLFWLWFSQGLCSVMGLLNHMIVLFVVFKGISIPSCIVAVSIYIPRMHFNFWLTSLSMNPYRLYSLWGQTIKLYSLLYSITWQIISTCIMNVCVNMLYRINIRMSKLFNFRRMKVLSFCSYVQYYKT